MKLKIVFDKILNYLTHDIWRIRLRSLPRKQYISLRLLRTLILALRGFRDDRCSLRATALTLYSFLAIVPVLAMAFGIAKGFDAQEKLKNVINEKIAGQEAGVQTQIGKFMTSAEELLDKTSGVEIEEASAETPLDDASDKEIEEARDEKPLDETSDKEIEEASAETLLDETSDKEIEEARDGEFLDKTSETVIEEAGADELLDKTSGKKTVGASAEELIEKTSGTKIAGVGFIILFWLVMKLFVNIEDTFNHIWGMTKGRSFSRRILDYLPFFFICLFLILVLSSLNVLTAAEPKIIAKYAPFASSAWGAFAYSTRKALPYLMAWLLFSFIYVYMPNIKVRLRSGVFAGIVAGTIFLIVQWAYITFQVGLSKNELIYGSFAAIPLLMLWIHVSWLVVLFGAEISFAVDNEETYEFEFDSSNASARFKKLLALRISELTVKRFIAGDKPITPRGVALQLEAPIRLVREVIQELVKAGILVEVKSEDVSVNSYHPACDPEGMTISSVLEKLEKRGEDNRAMVKEGELKALSATLEAIEGVVKESPRNVRLKDL
ncbi:YhjD/YihY/BrkB family envelope integrity protein [Candidatus Hydrogenedentota bacterium]